MEVRGFVNWMQEDEILENKIIIAEPGADFAVRVQRDNVTIRNVVIYHAANSRGIYAWEADNLTIENVEVIAYGNPYGANPCPSRKPFNGYGCVNI